jgi:hypothetical protein
LKDVFRTEDGSFDLTPFKTCLKENDLEASKVDMERHGAIGRFRMCAGLMLRHQATKLGFVVIGGKKIQVPGAKKCGRKAKKRLKPMTLSRHSHYKELQQIPTAEDAPWRTQRAPGL